MKIFLFLAAVVIAAAGALWSGLYNMSALEPHWDITHEIIAIARDRSITVHSANVKVPPLDDPKLSTAGVSHYAEMCRVCHGAPGVPPEGLAHGLYPAPANLLSGHAQKRWKDNELFWIVENGLKMTGMPAFGPTHNRDEMLGIVAFLKRLPGMTPEQYRVLAGGTATGGHGGGHDAPHSHPHSQPHGQ
ncbi:MAG: cytochrome c [Syntrophobacteraceae bacterium]